MVGPRVAEDRVVRISGVDGDATTFLKLCIQTFERVWRVYGQIKTLRPRLLAKV
jgi:hypothetical protein